MIHATLPWTEKYRPRQLDELCGNKEGFQKIQLYGKEHKNVLVIGPPGTGKSSAIRSFVKGYPAENVLFFDARMKARTFSQIASQLSQFLIQQLKQPERCVVIEEIDTFTASEQNTLYNCISEHGKQEGTRGRCTFFFLCNDRELVNESIVHMCLIVIFDTLKFTQVYASLTSLCKKERIKCSKETIKYIFEGCDRDLRKTISCMQYLSLLTPYIKKCHFEELVFIHEANYEKILDVFVEEGDTFKIADRLYSEGIQVTIMCYYVALYLKKKSALTPLYVNCICSVLRLARTTPYPYFLYFRLFHEMPLRVPNN